MRKILVVDDHEIVVKGISQMLSGGGYDVVESTDAIQALAILKHVGDISLIVCDLSLPTIENGMELIEKVREQNPALPIIVFTMHEELWTIKSLMDIGAEGIVLKGDNPKELLHAVTRVINGEEYFSEQFRRLRSEVMVSNGILSIKEIRIMKGITSGRKNSDIAESLGISEKTVEFHRCSILRKLGAKTIAEATRRAFEMGLLAMILLLFVFTLPVCATDDIDIYCNNGKHHCITGENNVEVSFSRNKDDGEWMLVANISPDSVLSVRVSTIDSVSVNRPLLTHGDAIDMGVSVLWANRNVGAERPEDFGAFYAFGETEEKDIYNYTNYKFCPPDDKYLINVYPIDNEISATELDPAHVHWGNGWRMPTLVECQELIEKCTHRNLIYNGVSGMIIIAENGNTMFLPLAGTKRVDYYQNPVQPTIGKEGVFMSGTSNYIVEEEDGEKYSCIEAWGFGITNDDGFVTIFLNPIFGMNVRAVRSVE